MHSRILLVTLIAALISFPVIGEEPPVPCKIIAWGGGGWKDHQVHEPLILVNPKDASKLIMIYGGAAKDGSAGALGKAWANAADPYQWHEDASNPFMRGNPAIAFESDSIRVDQVFYMEALDEYWIYYSGRSKATGRDAIGLATCAAGADGYTNLTSANIKRFGGNPVLSPGGQGRSDETYVSQGTIFRENGVWHSFYSYRTATQTLPGIRLATSRDGKEWRKEPGADLITAAPESQYLEWHQVYKIGDLYVMLMEAYNEGKRWRANVAVSSKLTEGWKKLQPTLIDQTQWPAYSDQTQFHIATPAIYTIKGKWYFYCQAAKSGPYINQNWAMYCLEFDGVMKKIISGTADK